MPIRRPCFRCGKSAYARHRDDTTRLCWPCWRDMKQAQAKTRVTFGRKRKHLATSETSLRNMEIVVVDYTAEGEIDAYWEAHPELTRKQAERRMQHATS